LQVEQSGHDDVVLRERRRQRVVAQRLEVLTTEFRRQERHGLLEALVLALGELLESCQQRLVILREGGDARFYLVERLLCIVPLRFQPRDPVVDASLGVAPRQLLQLGVRDRSYVLRMFAQPQGDLQQSRVVRPCVGVADQARHLPVEPAQQGREGAAAGPVLAGSVAPLPEVHEERVVAVRLALGVLFLLAQGRFLVGVHRHTLGLARALQRALVLRIGPQPSLGGDLRVVDGLGGALDGLGCRVSLALEVVALLLQGGQALLQRVVVGGSFLEERHDLPVGIVEPLLDRAASQMLEPDSRQLLQFLAARRVELQQPVVGLAHLRVQGARTLLLVLEGALELGEGIASGDHAAYQSVMAPPVVGKRYSGSRYPACFSPKVRFWMMPSSSLSSRTRSKVASSTRRPHWVTRSVRPVSSFRIGTVSRRPFASMASTMT